MDAKSLLRAQKAQARIEHPYASYSASGVLKCSICAVPVKQWDAHLLTKQHRTSLAREKALQAKAAKRAAPESSSGSSAKRARLDAQTGSATGNGARDEAEDEEEDDGRPAGLPAGFFSAGNRPSTANDSDEADEGEGTSSAQGRSAAGPPAQATVSQSKPEPTGDAELDDFLASLEDDTPANLDVSQTATAALAAGTSGTPAVIQKKKGYQSSSTLDTPGVASYVAAPVLLNQATDDAEGGDEPAEPEETEEERRERLAREEREEIMGRLEEEERAQEDADSRVLALKARMEALKKRREARPGKAAKANGK